MSNIFYEFYEKSGVINAIPEQACFSFIVKQLNDLKSRSLIEDELPSSRTHGRESTEKL